MWWFSDNDRIDLPTVIDKGFISVSGSPHGIPASPAANERGAGRGPRSQGVRSVVGRSAMAHGKAKVDTVPETVRTGQLRSAASCDRDVNGDVVRGAEAAEYLREGKRDLRCAVFLPILVNLD